MKMDEYEKELLELEEKGLIRTSKPSAKEKKALMEAAKSTLQKDRRINIRISNRDLVSLKRKANRFGMPYQTLISSVLHRYVSGDIQVEPIAGGDATRSRS
jgi:predicted DNA binding CopG/RHH family protein